jgi:hypothetical protein
LPIIGSGVAGLELRLLEASAESKSEHGLDQRPAAGKPAFSTDDHGMMTPVL